MGNTASYVTWDQLIQLGLLLVTTVNLVYIICKNHRNKK